MSELERLEDETSNTAPLSRVVEEPAPEVDPTPAEAAAPDATGSPGASTTSTNAGTSRPPALNPDGTPRKKRRRGSRGGRNRKKPGQSSGQGGQQGPRPQQSTRVS